MKTIQISFNIPDYLLTSLNQDREEFTKQSRLFIALQLFKNHKVTSGQAAEIVGMDKYKFISKLDEYGIDFIDYDPSELEDELESLRK